MSKLPTLASAVEVVVIMCNVCKKVCICVRSCILMTIVLIMMILEGVVVVMTMTSIIALHDVTNASSRCRGTEKRVRRGREEPPSYHIIG